MRVRRTSPRARLPEPLAWHLLRGDASQHRIYCQGSGPEVRPPQSGARELVPQKRARWVSGRGGTSRMRRCALHLSRPSSAPLFVCGTRLERGVQPSRLRARDLEQPFRGVRVQSNNVGQRPLLQNDESDALRAEVLASARAYALRMEPHEFFSHSTAAHIWGVPLPPLRTSKLHVSVVAPHRPVRVRGVVAHEAQPHLTRVVTHADSGLRVSSPATTWATLGSELWHPYDLVAAGDAFIRVQRFPGPWFRQLPPPLARFDQLEAAVRAGRRVGRPALRASSAEITDRFRVPHRELDSSHHLRGGTAGARARSRRVRRSRNIHRMRRPGIPRTQDRDRVRG